MKKFLLTATAVAALSVISTSALAVNLDDGTGLNTYANELLTDNTTVLQGAGLNVDHQLGVGMAAPQTVFLKYQLTNGVFATAVVAADLVVPGGASAAIHSGGAALSSTVIFTVTLSGPLPPTLAINQVISFNLGSGVGVKMGVKSSPVTMDYNVHQLASEAVAGTNSLYNKSNTVAAFDGGLVFKATANTTTADVLFGYKQFLDAQIPFLTAKIGTLDYGVRPNVKRPIGTNAILSNFVFAGTKLVVKTNSTTAPLEAADDVYLSSDALCATGGGTLFGENKLASSVDIEMNTTASAGRAICYKANTPPLVPVAIEVQEFTVELAVVAAAGTTTASKDPINLGQFKQNGTVLKHSFAEAAAGSTGYLQAVHLTNTSSTGAPFTVRCLKPTGFDVGVPDTLAAGTARRYGLTSICPATPAAQLRGIELTFAVTNGRVFGAMVRQNLTTGEASFDTMIGSF